MTTEHEDRLSNLGELATVLAHEMKNPMNSIIINLEVLRSTMAELCPQADHPQLLKAKRYLEIIEGEVRRLDKVLRGFLDFANPPQSTRTQFKINPVIKLMTDFMAQEFKQKGITFSLDLDSDLPPYVGSADQFKQALLNLMINSIQAMPKGGELKIQTIYENAEIVLRISDTGIGIEPAVLNRIYDPYFTTKTRGSGLGLTVVKRFVKDHGGRIDVQSEQGKGTTFDIRLPTAS